MKRNTTQSSHTMQMKTHRLDDALDESWRVLTQLRAKREAFPDAAGVADGGVR